MKLNKSLFVIALSAVLSSCVFTTPNISSSGTSNPTSAPTSAPTSVLTSEPTSEPSSETTSASTSLPTSTPTSAPTSVESSDVTIPTSNVSSGEPTSAPTSAPTSELISASTSAPTSTPTSEPTSAPTSITTSEPTSTPTSAPTSTSEEPVEDNSRIDYITLNKRTMEVAITDKISNVDVQLTVNFFLKEEGSEFDNSVTWSSNDTNIATVDQYGRVKGIAVGKTIVTCTTVEGNRQASCTIYVVESHESVQTKWTKVTHQNELSVGDILVMGCPQAGVTATDETTGMYLHSTISTFSATGDKITSLGELSEQFILGGEMDNWTLEGLKGKYLATTHTGKVTYILKTGNVTWTIDYDNEWSICDMRSASNIDGWFMYNQKADKFTTYESNEQIDMFVISLYKLVRIYE